MERQGASLQISLLAPQFRLKVPHRSPRQPTLDLHRTAKTEIRRHDPGQARHPGANIYRPMREHAEIHADPKMRTGRQTSSCEEHLRPGFPVPTVIKKGSSATEKHHTTFSVDAAEVSTHTVFRSRASSQTSLRKVFDFARKKESLQSGLHSVREDRHAQEGHGRGAMPSTAVS
jgi:hypothetical protein